MTEPLLKDIAEDDIAAYRRDGAFCLRGHFDNRWLARLAKGVDDNIAQPGTVATEHRLDDGAGRFFEDYCNWRRIAEYRDFVLTSPAARIAAAFMGSETVQIFHEHVLVKEPGTTKKTPWHHDMPYYCVQGSQVISLWMPLDPVPRAVCPEFVAGSHVWGKLFYPRKFDDGADYDYAGGGFETMPDIDANRGDYKILSWGLEPGDAILFHYLTVHGAPGNPGAGRRRAFSSRWLGDDARFAERPGTTSPPFPGIGQADGERLREDWFPTVLRRAEG